MSKKKPGKKKPVKKKTASRKAAVAKPDSGDSEPIEWYTITDPEQVKLITNDLRSRILIEFAKEELTAKQVAEKLGEPPTKFYRHVAALAEHGLIVPTREEKKRGTIQQFYRAIARRFRVDDTCFSGDESGADTKVGTIFKLLNTISNELTQSTQDSVDEYVAALTSPFHAPESLMEEIGDKLFDAIVQVFAEYEKTVKPKKTDKEYRISLLVHPAAAVSPNKKKKKTGKQKKTGQKSTGKRKKS